MICPLERVARDDLSLRALAMLRMTVFRGWPYLYDGSVDYEATYLDEFLSSQDAPVIVARVGDIPVGMATAPPMTAQSDMIKEPFRKAGFNISAIHYFGESVLLPQFRGQGIGHRFSTKGKGRQRLLALPPSAPSCATARIHAGPKVQGTWRAFG